jgi:hypothetical protein
MSRWGALVAWYMPCTFAASCCAMAAASAGETPAVSTTWASAATLPA